MKKFILLLALVLMITSVFSQDRPTQVSNVFIPKTLYSSTLMSGRTAATTYDDTTKMFETRNWGKVYVGIETATNDSVRILLSYSVTKDGQNYSSYVLFDSLSSTGTVGIVKYFELPASAMGAFGIRLRVYGDADVARYSANPSTTVTTKIIRKQY